MKKSLRKMKKIIADNKGLFCTLAFLYVIALGLPLIIEYLVPMPSGKHGDWLNFWSQYLGTWIALTGSSIIAIIVATFEVRSNQRTSLYMFQINERIKYAFELIDLVSEMMLQTEFPVFRKKDASDITVEDWATLVTQVFNLQNAFAQLIPRINSFRYKLPADLVNKFWDVFSQNSGTLKIEEDIIAKAHHIVEAAKLFVKTTDKVKKDKIKNTINDECIGINKKVFELRPQLAGLCGETQKFIDNLELTNNKS
ncbi:hypothetical protein GKC44_00425 [Lactobacillus parabuchneri]|uniref:Uncharacterized protein n=1 Tax=Lentilactobacillus parabuchneri TaxID=152331 RepID=A0A844EJD3_9LACO|nr:hypothetical protein [Lentilactobacillus parabuchneri]